MAIAASVETEEITVTLPTDVLVGIDQFAAEKGLSRSEMLTAAARRYLFSERRWKETQAAIAEAARRAGLRTEDDIEDLLDSLPDPPA